MPVPEKKYDAVYRSPPACPGSRVSGDRVVSINWLPDEDYAFARVPDRASQVIDALEQYFINPLFVPDFSFSPEGTQFQRNVWRALCKIPAGRVMTYGELAGELKTGSRGIGQACRTNPVSIFITCRRVVAVNGAGGYMGKHKQLRIKQWLLVHEQKACR